MSLKEKKETIERLCTKRFMARLKSVQALYQWLLMHKNISDIIEDFLKMPFFPEEGKKIPLDLEHFEHIVCQVVQHEDYIKKIISHYLDPKWPLERIDTILAAVLYAGIYELAFRKDIPQKVVINEYINVARAFFGEGDMLRVVNGTLDKIAKDLVEEKILVYT